jgi:hypothetical protein
MMIFWIVTEELYENSINHAIENLVSINGVLLNLILIISLSGDYSSKKSKSAEWRLLFYP